MKTIRLLALVGVSALFSACSFAPTPSVPPSAMMLTSPAFTDGGTIPAQYTCTGVGESPPLAFSGVPAGAQSFVLILSDPDAPSGDFVHWVVYNIDPAMRAVPAGTVPEAGSLGRSGTGQQEYVPPCLPSGTHRYLFHLYALDTLLSFYAPPTKTDLLTSMQGHVLAEVELMGRFWRL